MLQTLFSNDSLNMIHSKKIKIKRFQTVLLHLSPHVCVGEVRLLFVRLVRVVVVSVCAGMLWSVCGGGGVAGRGQGGCDLGLMPSGHVLVIVSLLL